jgi:hypothetical protein
MLAQLTEITQFISGQPLSAGKKHLGRMTDFIKANRGR